nr:immunoglobulin heavy chain junction region [Macaca mulatta]
CARGHSSFDVW